VAQPLLGGGSRGEVAVVGARLLDEHEPAGADVARLVRAARVARLQRADDLVVADQDRALVCLGFLGDERVGDPGGQHEVRLALVGDRVSRTVEHESLPGSVGKQPEPGAERAVAVVDGARVTETTVGEHIGPVLVTQQLGQRLEQVPRGLVVGRINGAELPGLRAMRVLVVRDQEEPLRGQVLERHVPREADLGDSVEHLLRAIQPCGDVDLPTLRRAPCVRVIPRRPHVPGGGLPAGRDVRGAVARAGVGEIRERRVVLVMRECVGQGVDHRVSSGLRDGTRGAVRPPRAGDGPARGSIST
jgi:hypothetical protein